MGCARDTDGDGNCPLHPRRCPHRDDYPTDMQEVGDLLHLWDANGFLISREELLNPTRP